MPQKLKTDLNLNKKKQKIVNKKPITSDHYNDTSTDEEWQKFGDGMDDISDQRENSDRKCIFRTRNRKL